MAARPSTATAPSDCRPRHARRTNCLQLLQASNPRRNVLPQAGWHTGDHIESVPPLFIYLGCCGALRLQIRAWNAVIVACGEEQNSIASGDNSALTSAFDAGRRYSEFQVSLS